MNIVTDENGILRYEDGTKVNTRDYLLTKPYIKRYYDFNTKNISALNTITKSLLKQNQKLFKMGEKYFILKKIGISL